MKVAYSPEIQSLHSRDKRMILDRISDVDCQNYFENRSEKLEQELNKSSVPAILQILEWNSRHADLRTSNSENGIDVAEELNVKMLEEVDEYHEALESNKRLLNQSSDKLVWYKKDEAKLLWKIGGEIADAAVFAVGLLEALSYNARQIVNVADMASSGRESWKNPPIKLTDNHSSVLARSAIHVINNVGLHTEKIGVPIRSILFYKALLNEQHRSSALKVPLQLNGYSSTLRRSVGPLVWDSKTSRKAVDSQIPALSQSWVGPTVIETHIEKNEYEVENISISNLDDIGELPSFSDLYPEPLTRQKEIILWRLGQ